jgi:polar amino acid transport system substrate-binding protein
VAAEIHTDTFGSRSRAERDTGETAANATPDTGCVTHPDTAIITDLAPQGVLRASINLGNPVLAQGTPTDPAGVTVDIAREVGARLGVPVEFVCFDAARKSLQAMIDGAADICFLAIEPAREAEVAFTAPYVLIEGVYAVPDDSPLITAADVDRPGVRVGVNRGAAYDLYLSRTLRHATVVRADEGMAVFRAECLEAVAGIREPVTEFVTANPGFRVLDGQFMEIRQAVGTATAKRPETVRFLTDVVEDLKRSGFVADSLRRSGQTAPVAPPSA